MENTKVTPESIKQLTEDLLSAQANFKSAESVLEKAKDALTEEYRKGGGTPEQFLVHTSEGWILLEFNTENKRFDKFEKFEKYAIVIG